MPNTLAHIGVQWPLSRWLIGPAVDPRWVLVGCFIPDVPWIMMRALRVFPIPIDSYTLRLYGIVLATLLVCAFLVAAIVVVAENRARTAVTLGLGCVFHLLLDATQIKWGNGVHLFAPASWDLVSWGWFWPESIPTLAMTVAGLCVAGWLIIREGRRRPSSPFRRLRPTTVISAGALLACYFLSPLALADGPLHANNHDIATLRDTAHRTGRTLDLDRGTLHVGETGAELETFARERILVENPPPGGSGTLSIKGTFESPSRIRLTDYHRHLPALRNGASVLGLLMIAVVWGRSFR